MLEIIIDYQFPYEKVGKSYRIIEPIQPSPFSYIICKILYFFIITFSSLILVRNSFFNLSDSILYSIFLRILNVL